MILIPTDTGSESLSSIYLRTGFWNTLAVLDQTSTVPVEMLRRRLRIKYVISVAQHISSTAIAQQRNAARLAVTVQTVQGAAAYAALARAYHAGEYNAQLHQSVRAAQAEQLYRLIS